MLQVHEVVLIVFFFLTGQLIIQAATSPVGYLRAVGKPETQREDGAIRQEGRHEMPRQKESSNLSFQTTKKCRLMDCPVGYYYLCIPLKNDEKTFRERCDFGVCERFEEGRRLVDDNGNIDSVHCQNNTYRNSPFTICEFDKTYCVEKHVFTGKGEYTIFGPSHTVDDNIRGCRKGYQKTSDGCILTTTMPTGTMVVYENGYIDSVPCPFGTYQPSSFRLCDHYQPQCLPKRTCNKPGQRTIRGQSKTEDENKCECMEGFQQKEDGTCIENRTTAESPTTTAESPTTTAESPSNGKVLKIVLPILGICFAIVIGVLVYKKWEYLKKCNNGILKPKVPSTAKQAGETPRTKEPSSQSENTIEVELELKEVEHKKEERRKGSVGIIMDYDGDDDDFNDVQQQGDPLLGTLDPIPRVGMTSTE